MYMYLINVFPTPSFFIIYYFHDSKASWTNWSTACFDFGGWANAMTLSGVAECSEPTFWTSFQGSLTATASVYCSRIFIIRRIERTGANTSVTEYKSWPDSNHCFLAKRCDVSKRMGSKRTRDISVLPNNTLLNSQSSNKRSFLNSFRSLIYHDNYAFQRRFCTMI